MNLVKKSEEEERKEKKRIENLKKKARSELK